MFLTDDTIKDIQKMRFAPGATAVYDTLEKGISILTCLPIRPETIADLQREAQCEKDTESTRTLSESRQLSKKAPRIPARGYHALLANITSYSTLLMALFGRNCGHYKGVQVLLELMRGLSDKQSYFTHQYCKEITFAILDDSRRFFSNYITPDKFNMGIYHNTLVFPTSMLHLVAQEVNRLLPIATWDFPEQWKEVDNKKRGPGNELSGFRGGLTPYETPRGTGKGGGLGSHLGFKELIPQGWTSDPHPKIAAMMKTYKKIHERVRMPEILSAANTKMIYLPKMAQYTNERGQSTICAHHVLGKCSPFFGKCEYIHAPRKDLTDAFVDGFITLLKPGIDVMCQPSYVPAHFEKNARTGALHRA
jgi:hypothetical protein